MTDLLFLDLDDTILDFRKTEEVAISRIFKELGISFTKENVEIYRRINLSLWHRLERGELNLQQVKFGCFSALFRAFGIEGDSDPCAAEFEQLLGTGHYFLPGAEEAVRSLAKKYRLFIVSNGSTAMQRNRLASAGILALFEDVFISQDIGVNKPYPEFFTRSFERISNFDPQKSMIVGDSLTLDILGGKNAGIVTCWICICVIKK